MNKTQQQFVFEIKRRLTERHNNIINEDDMEEFMEFPPIPKKYQECDTLMVEISIADDGALKMGFDNALDPLYEWDLEDDDVFKLWNYINRLESWKKFPTWHDYCI